MKLNWSKLIELNESEIATVNEVSAVYRISYLNPNDGKYYVFYVGQAQNLKTRLTEHLPENEKNKCCRDYLEKYTCFFRAAVVKNQSDRDGAEVALYNHFSPSCPERIPDVDSIDINFE